MLTSKHSSKRVAKLFLVIDYKLSAGPCEQAAGLQNWFPPNGVIIYWIPSQSPTEHLSNYLNNVLL